MIGTDEQASFEAPDHFYADPAGQTATAQKWTISRGSELIGAIVYRPGDNAIFVTRTLLGMAKRKDGHCGVLRDHRGDVLYFASVEEALARFREDEFELEAEKLGALL